MKKIAMEQETYRNDSLSPKLTVFTERDSPKDSDSRDDYTVYLKKNSKKKFSKRLLMKKIHVNNTSRKPYKVVLPRILSTDIRKHYSTMFLNLLNNADADLITLFFQTFTNCNTSVQHVLLPRPLDNTRRTLQYPTFEQPLRQDFTTFHDVTKFFEATILSIPDRIFTMKSAVVITRSDTFKTEIVVDFRGVSHKVFDLDPAEMAALLVTMRHQLGGLENMTAEDLSTMMKDSFRATPVPLVVQGRYTIVINDYRESNRIDKIIIETCPLKD